MMYLLLACTGADPLDSAAPADTDVEREVLTCETLEIRADGEDPPGVGDTWTVLLWCDDTLLMGTTRVFFDPTDFATISENEVTFLYAGQAELTVQVGSKRGTRIVTVYPES